MNYDAGRQSRNIIKFIHFLSLLDCSDKIARARLNVIKINQKNLSFVLICSIVLVYMPISQLPPQMNLTSLAYREVAYVSILLN